MKKSTPESSGLDVHHSHCPQARPGMKNPVTRAFRKELTRIQKTTIDAKKNSDNLKAKRDLLFARFLKTPSDTHLALEIKITDDQIVEYVKQMQQQREKRI
jgi:hypothetical protein